jgi:hypothetical protein
VVIEKTPPLKLQYSITKLEEKPKWRNSHSFLKNFCIPFKMIIGGITSRTTSYEELGAKDINGDSATLRDTSSGNRSLGRLPEIHVGNPTSPFTIYPGDYCLYQEVSPFSASSNPQETQGVVVSGNQSLFDYSSIVTFDEDIYVTEIGLSTLLLCSETEFRFLLVHDIVNPSVHMTANTPYVIRYRLIMTA